jgi:hypothetical protein
MSKLLCYVVPYKISNLPPPTQIIILAILHCLLFIQWSIYK